jgi:hypothetical protein
MPAKAGIQVALRMIVSDRGLDSRFHGNDGLGS